MLRVPASYVVTREQPDSLRLSLSRTPPAPSPEPCTGELTVLSPSTPTSGYEDRRNRARPLSLAGCLISAGLLWGALAVVSTFLKFVPGDLLEIKSHWPALPFSVQVLLCITHECAELAYLGVAFYFVWSALRPSPASDGVLCNSLALSKENLSLAGENVPLALVKHFRVVSRVEKDEFLGLHLRRTAASFGVEAVTYGHPVVLAPISSRHVAEATARALNEFVDKCRAGGAGADGPQTLTCNDLPAALCEGPVGRSSLFGSATATLRKEVAGKAQRISLVFTSLERNKVSFRWVAVAFLSQQVYELLLLGKLPLARLSLPAYMAVVGLFAFGGVLCALTPTCSEQWNFDKNDITVQTRRGRAVCSTYHLPIADLSHLNLLRGSETELEGYETESGRRHGLSLVKKDNIEVRNSVCLLEAEAMGVASAVGKHMKTYLNTQDVKQT